MTTKPKPINTSHMVPGGPTLEKLLETDENYQHLPLHTLLPPDPEAPPQERELQLSLFPTTTMNVEKVLALMEELNFTEKELAQLLFHIPLTENNGPIINRRLAFEFSQLPVTFVQQLLTFATLVTRYSQIGNTR